MSGEAGTGQDNTGAGEGGEQTSFLDGITNEDLKGNEILTGYNEDGKGLEALAQDYVDLKGSQPTLPENIDGYKFDLPEGAQVDEAGMNAFKEAALEAKFTPEQYNAAVAFRVAEMENITKSVEESREAAIEELKADPKYGGDKFEGNLAMAQKLLAKYEATDILTEDITAALSADNAKDLLGNKTGLFRLLIDIANDFSEDHFETGGGNKGDDKRQTDEAGKPLMKFKDMG